MSVARLGRLAPIVALVALLGASFRPPTLRNVAFLESLTDTTFLRNPALSNPWK